MRLTRVLVSWLVMAALLLAFVPTVFAAGQQEGGAEAGQGEQNVLRVGAAAWMHEKFPLEDAARRFEENHPGVEVELLKTQEFDTSVMMQMRQGETNYDILMPFQAGTMKQFLELDLLAPVGDVFDNEEYMVDGEALREGDLLGGYMELMRVDGETYGLPVFGEVAMLGYRTDYMQEAGLSSPPETWEELASYANQLNTDDTAGYTAILGRGLNSLITLMTMVKGKGGEVVDDEGNFNLTSPEAIESMQQLVDMYRNDQSIQQSAAETFNAPRDGFKAGSVAMANFWHSWALESADVFGQDNLALAPLPGTEENGTIIYAGGAIIPNMGNVELAKLFAVEMLQAKWFQQWSAENYYKAPVRRQNLEGLSGSYWEDMPPLVDNGEFFPAYANAQQMYDTFGRNLLRALNGQVSAEEALQQTYDEISQMRR